MMTMMTMIIVRVTMAMGMVTVMMFIIMMLEIVLIYLLKLADHGEKSNSHKVVSPLKL